MIHITCWVLIVCIIVIMALFALFAIALCKCASESDEKIEELLNEQKMLRDETGE